MISDVKNATDASPVSDQEFEFTLKIRVECLKSLWQAAAVHCMSQYNDSTDDLIDLIGPQEDPSIEDCLMALVLPERVSGCVMLNAVLEQQSGGQAG